ncbi:hypothetical protein [Burkholderia stabilis]|uniref:hypothetical protein n=1 Tax=Burkholderia stabilis TaxID=95485 RepID=UPI001F4A814F|nr:hypothetical protein [Burkholderia stabilis]
MGFLYVGQGCAFHRTLIWRDKIATLAQACVGAMGVWQASTARETPLGVRFSFASRLLEHLFVIQSSIFIMTSAEPDLVSLQEVLFFVTSFVSVPSLEKYTDVDEPEFIPQFREALFRYSTAADD